MYIVNYGYRKEMGGMEFSSTVPIYLQVEADIKQRIIKKEILPGSRLPSAAELAMAYKINPNTVQRIFKELEREGICYTRRGIGTYIVEDEALTERLKKELVDELTRNFVSGMRALGYSINDIINEINEENQNAEI